MSNPDFWLGPSTNVPVVNANGNIFEEVQVATAGQTVFTLASFQYTPGSKSIFVFKNGVLLRRAVDYTETSATQVTLAVGAALNDKIEFNAIAINQLIAPVVFNGLPSGGTAGQILQKIDGSDYHASWAAASSVTTLLDAARVNIASASTVNLSAIAATTRNIQITGSIQIDGFQVTNGQVWIAKFAASLILKNNANIVTQAGQDIRVGPNDTCIIRATADNVVEIISYSAATNSIPRIINNFRLTALTGVAVPTADVTGATILYCTPYLGNEISLYNGISWVTRTSAEFSLALAGLTIARPYDVYCYDNAGVPTLEFLAWTSAHVRATALAKQDGIYVKSGDATRRYLGTFYALTATTTEDSIRQRLVWNYYNRVTRYMKVFEATASWNYSGVPRQANGNANNQLNVVAGVAEDNINLSSKSAASTATAGWVVQTGIGADSTIAFTGNLQASFAGVPVVSATIALDSKLVEQATLGYTAYTLLETSPSGSASFVGSSAYTSLVGQVFG